MTATDRQKLIDEAGALEETVAPYLAPIKRLETLRSEFRKWAEEDKVPGTDAKCYDGKTFTVTLTRRENKTRITSMKAVFKKLGPTKFVAIASITLEALREKLGAAAAQFLDEDRTGARKVVIARIPR